jgi:CheY-like chemotaxis protein
LDDGIDLLNSIKKSRSEAEIDIKMIFIDENMDFLNGSETVLLLKKFERNGKIKKIPIISVTAFDDKDNLSTILSSGVDKIISKPVSLQILLNCFAEYL